MQSIVCGIGWDRVDSFLICSFPPYLAVIPYSETFLFGITTNNAF